MDLSFSSLRQFAAAQKASLFRLILFPAMLLLPWEELVAAEEEGPATREIASHDDRILPLVIPLGKDVEATVRNQEDFAVFDFQKKSGAQVSASMHVYVGHFPRRLHEAIKDADFVDDQPAWFARERAAWHVWLPVIDGRRNIACKAYLYNTYTRPPHWIVEVSIYGSDREDVRAFQQAAEKMVFKGLEKEPTANEQK